MADEDLTWAITLVDRTSNPASKADKAIEKLMNTMAASPKALAKVEDGLDRVNKKLEQLAGPVKFEFAENIAELGYKAADGVMRLAEAVGHLAASFAEAALEGMAFKEQNLITFKAMLGSEGAADNRFERSVLFARHSAFKTNDVISSFKSILGAGFKENEAENIFAGLGDVASLSGTGSAGMSAMLMQMAEAKGLGTFGLRHLRALMLPATQAGLTMGMFFDQLNKDMGTKLSHEELQKRLTEGENGPNGIKADTAINAFMEAIRDHVSGGKLGSMTLAHGESLAGLGSSLASLPQDLFSQMNTRGGGFLQIKGFAKDLLGVLGPAVDQGGRLNVLMQSIVDKVGNLVAKITAEDISSVVDKITSAAEFGMEILDDIGDTFTAVKPDLVAFADQFSKTFGLDNKHALDGFKTGFELMGAAVSNVVRPITELMALMDRFGDALNRHPNLAKLFFGYGFARESAVNAGAAKNLEELKKYPELYNLVSENQIKGAAGDQLGAVGVKGGKLRDDAQPIHVQQTNHNYIDARGGDGQEVYRKLQDQNETDAESMFVDIATETGSRSSKARRK